MIYTMGIVHGNKNTRTVRRSYSWPVLMQMDDTDGCVRGQCSVCEVSHLLQWPLQHQFAV